MLEMTASPLVVAHRGARWCAVENSLEALRIAAQDGADGVEYDVQLTADGEPVLFHDASLQRLIGLPKRLADVTWRELRPHVVRADGPRGPLQPQPVCHLGDWLMWSDALPLWHNLELKVERNADPRPLVETVVDWLARAGWLQRPRLLLSSFSEAALRHARALVPELRLGLLCEPAGRREVMNEARLGAARAQLGLSSLHPAHEDVTESLLGLAAEHELDVLAWTANTPAAWERLTQPPVRGIITDDPQGLLAFCARHRLR